MAATCSEAARKTPAPAWLRKSATVNEAGLVIGSPPCRSARIVDQDRQMAVPAQRRELVATVGQTLDSADRHELVQHPGHKPDVVGAGPGRGSNAAADIGTSARHSAHSSGGVTHR